MAVHPPTLRQIPQSPMTDRQSGYATPPWVMFFQKLNQGASSLFTVLSADPTSPADGTAWFFLDGATPESLSLRVRRGGVTYDIPLFTFP